MKFFVAILLMLLMSSAALADHNDGVIFYAATNGIEARGKFVVLEVGTNKSFAVWSMALPQPSFAYLKTIDAAAVAFVAGQNKTNAAAVRAAQVQAILADSNHDPILMLAVDRLKALATGPGISGTDYNDPATVISKWTTYIDASGTTTNGMARIRREAEFKALYFNLLLRDP